MSSAWPRVVRRVPLRARHASLYLDVQAAVRKWPGASLDDLQQILPYHASYSLLYSLVEEAGEDFERTGSHAGLAVEYVGRKLQVFDAAITSQFRLLGRVLVDDKYRAIIRFLKANPNSKRTAIEQAIGLKAGQLERKLTELVEGGQILRTPIGATNHPDTRYSLTPQMEECTDFQPFREAFMGERVKTPQDYRRPC